MVLSRTHDHHHRKRLYCRNQAAAHHHVPLTSPRGFCISGLPGIGLRLLYPSSSLFPSISSSLGYRKRMDFCKNCNATSSDKTLNIPAVIPQNTHKNSCHAPTPVFQAGDLSALLHHFRLPDPSLDLGEKNISTFSRARLGTKQREEEKRKHLPSCAEHYAHKLRPEKATMKSPCLGIPRATTLNHMRY